MRNKDFNRYAEEALGCMDIEAGLRLKALWERYRFGSMRYIDYDIKTESFTTIIGVIPLKGNPILKEQVDELERFLAEQRF